MPSRGRILVVGGGIAGLTAAIEAAEAGCDVVLIERQAQLGGRVAQMYQYFPKLCPPVCGLEINLRRMRTSPRIESLTLAEVEAITGTSGRYQVSVRQQPRFVAERCSACGKCAEACPAERPRDFDFGMKTGKAAYLAYPGAWPARYAIDPKACLSTPHPNPLPTSWGEGTDLRLPGLAQRGEGGGEGLPCTKCVDACPTKAIDLTQKAHTFTLDVQAVIWATGWEPYQPTRLTDLGFGAHPDVITNMMMERLASPTGPTGGRIVRPSNDQAPANIAFVQCAGSRDDAHLAYCSGLCCMASAKHARYVRAQHPSVEIFIYYIDRRASGRQETFLAEAERDEKVHFVPGKVARVSVEPGSPVVEVEDTSKGSKLKQKVDLVVLATGMVAMPTSAALAADRFGFLSKEQPSKGQLIAGCARGPMDVAATVRDATSTVLHALGHCEATR